ncbi:MAG: diacylglycerol kinase family protein [Candidatus Microgenomates bacterium]|jgi:diacylglycerol kinase
MESKHSLTKSFQYALEGLKTGITKGRNFRIQIATGVLATLLGIILKISHSDWVDLVLVMASVLILELINTAIEAIVDMVSPEIQEKAKIAKDVSAGAVLVASIAAVFIGGLIFLPKILH